MKYQKILELEGKLTFMKHQQRTQQKSHLYFMAALCHSYQESHFKGDETKVQRNTKLILSIEAKL